MKFLKEFTNWVFSILIAVVMAMGISIFVFQPTQVQGISMENTFHTNDRVLVNKLFHTLRQEPQHGDIVIIDSRVNRPRTFKDDITDTAQYNLLTKIFFKSTIEEVFWIKRVIGKAGDKIEVKDGKLYLNRVLVDEPYIKEPMAKQADFTVVVPEGCVFVMGDNRNNSMDSRVIGSVPIDHVLGKFFYKF